MTRINKNTKNQRTRMINKSSTSRIEQIIRDGIDRAAEQDHQFILKTISPIGDYRRFLATFYSCAV